jgi:hypothetical protein
VSPFIKYYISPEVVQLFESSQARKWDKETTIALLESQRVFDKGFVRPEMLRHMGLWSNVTLETHQDKELYSITYLGCAITG